MQVHWRSCMTPKADPWYLLNRVFSLVRSVWLRYLDRWRSETALCPQLWNCTNHARGLSAKTPSSVLLAGGDRNSCILEKVGAVELLLLIYNKFKVTFPLQLRLSLSYALSYTILVIYFCRFYLLSFLVYSLRYAIHTSPRLCGAHTRCHQRI